MKVCFKCKLEKPREDFGIDKTRGDGLYSYCLPCTRIQRASQRKKVRETPEGRERLRRKGWLAMIATYGVTEAAYFVLLEKQDGLCAICRRPERFRNMDGLRPLCVDHDHETGEVRGLLCHSCNVAIGHFRDNPETLEAALRYLRGSARFVS